MEESKTCLNNKRERNFQKRDYNRIYRSNSQQHYKNISNCNYENRIRLNPLGEYGNHDIRYHIPSNHIRSFMNKFDHVTKPNKSTTSFDNAEIESAIASHLKEQKYQNLLTKDKNIKKRCENKNKEIKDDINKKKLRLKQEITRIINDTLLFSKKNNPVKSMLPENINEIVDKAKKETQDLSISINMSNLSKISSIKGDYKKQQKIEFLSLIGVDVDNMAYNHININIDKAWKYIKKFAKGKDTHDAAGYGLHEHVCTFELISNDKPWQKAQCKKWIKNHPVECDEYGPDCDFCEMLNYIALDDEGTMVFDTPGFTSFDILTASEEELQFLYPEIGAFAGQCRYDNCRHLAEPECAVKRALEKGEISVSRYRSYKEQMEELIK